MSSPEERSPRRRGRPPKAVTQQPAEELEHQEIEPEMDMLEAAGFESEGALGTAEQDEMGEEGEIEQPRPEDRMVQKIRARLESARGIDASEVQVEMERGVVVLNGHVRSDALRQKIVDSVSASGGVTVIRNRIRLSS